MIEVVHARIDVPAIMQWVATQAAGTFVYFIGAVRKEHEITGLHYEAYDKMVLKQMDNVAAAAKLHWPLEKIAIVHRLGWVPLGEAAVVIAVAAAHRKEAFAACEFIIDEIKRVVPIWKEGPHGKTDCQC